MSPQPRHRRGLRAAVAVATFAATIIAAAVPLAPAEAASSPQIKKARLGKGVTSDYKLKDPTTTFYGIETVWLLVQIKGRPKKGKLTSVWHFRGDEVGRATLDVSTINKGTIFSIGEDTFAKFHFAPGENPLPISKNYDVSLLVDGTETGVYKFSVVAPKGAVASKITAAKTETEDGNPSTNFAKNDLVVLHFEGDLGLDTWLEATWKVNGKVDDKGTRTLRIQENKKATEGGFSFAPAGGWPAGKHSVSLIMNDVSVGTYTFTVK